MLRAICPLTQVSSVMDKIADTDLQKYLEIMLSTTFILDDGTRVKAIFINWNDFTSSQVALVLDKIRDTCIQELKELGERSTLLLEFNEIPRELDEMLTNLVGADNPDIRWVLST
jgi:hypothetical protein